MEQKPPELTQTTLRNDSIFNPKIPGSDCLGAFKKMMESELRKLEKKESKNKNIWKTIKDIGKKKEVVIHTADKGGELVILNKKYYEDEMENLLKVENTYKKIKSNPKKQDEKKLKEFVKVGRDK